LDSDSEDLVGNKKFPSSEGIFSTRGLNPGYLKIEISTGEKIDGRFSLFCKAQLIHHVEL